MSQEIRIALAGNPNCGKTTLFNALTGSNQYVGNWPGVTVEKKEGRLKGREDVIIVDLPGIYSLSPYTLEEVVARQFLVTERPDAILNIVDGTNLERNLYLTTQLKEIGIPVVVAINMMDVVRKNGDDINIAGLSKAIGCKVIEISALKNDGLFQAAELAIRAAERGRQVLAYRHGGTAEVRMTDYEIPDGKKEVLSEEELELLEAKAGMVPKHIFSGPVEHALAHIEEAVIHEFPAEQQRWYAIKIFERDERVCEKLKISRDVLNHIETDIREAEEELDDDAESIITNDRYNYITSSLKGCYKKKNAGRLSTSDRIDKVVTNRILALPIFALVMLAVYTISIGTIGDWTVGFMNDTLFGGIISPAAESWLTGIGCADWLVGLVVDGIIGGVGAVLGFVPQMLILFLLLSILEDVGYMSRVAFIMDKLFRKFGLSGKSFIPMLVASGCGVPGVMASRTIEQDRDRKMTIMTTCFIPCGAKMPVVGLIAATLFGGKAWVATSAYFVGVAAVIVSGIILKKTKAFAGEPATFVMELPAYHAPIPKNVLRTTGERGWDFIKRAGTVILAASIIIWTLNSLSFEGGLHYITGDETSILNLIGSAIAVFFKPLGFGQWQTAVATILGLVAKEEIVGVFGSLSSMGDADLAFEMVEGMDLEGLRIIGQEFFGGSKLSAYSFMMFNLLCAPCFAAMGAIKREMNNAKWTFAAIGYMCVFAYSVSLMVYQLGMFFAGNGFNVGTAVACVIVLVFLWLLFRKNKYAKKGAV